MRTMSLWLACTLGLAAVASCWQVRAEESDRRAAEEQPLILPDAFERGSLHLSGFAGPPLHRVGFRVWLRPDGALRVETSSLAAASATQEARLTKEQTQAFYDAMVKIVGETDHNKTVAAVPDGWEVRATIELGGRKQKRTYDRFGSVHAISPEFRVIRDLIEKELPGVSLSAAKLSAPRTEEENDRIDLPATFEKGSLFIKAKNGGIGERSSFGIEVLPDGTLRVECKPFLGKNEKMTGQLTKEQTKQVYAAMVKIVGRGAREVVAGGAHCWITTAAIRFDEDGTKQEKRTFVEFGTLRLMSPHFVEIIDLVAKALPESPIREVAELSPAVQPAAAAEKKGDEIVLPATFERGSLHLTGSHGGIGDWSSFTIDLLSDGSLHVVVKPFRKEQADKTAQLTKEQTKKIYDATAKFIRGPSKRSAGFERGWDGSATIKLDKEGKHQARQGFWRLRAVGDMSPEIDEILDLIDKAVPGSGIDRLP